MDSFALVRLGSLGPVPEALLAPVTVGLDEMGPTGDDLGSEAGRDARIVLRRSTSPLAALVLGTTSS